MTTTKTRQKPRPKRPKQAVLLAATGDAKRDAAHVSRAVRGCSCTCCAMHRRLARGDDYGPGVEVG